MAQQKQSVKVIHGALDEEGKEIILRGVICNDSLPLLQTDEYQREVLPQTRIRDLAEAFTTGSVPDIELGMRGERMQEREGIIYLQDPVYIIDGLQRVTAAKFLLQQGGSPHLGATIHFDTTFDTERERFRILNMERTKLSPNVHLRNFKTDFAVVDMMYNLTFDRGFVLARQVCWAQRMKREDLLTATILMKVSGRLHARFGPGRCTNVPDLVRAMNTTMEKVGRNIFRENVRVFYEIVDTCWGLRNITFKEGATQLRANFLECLAEVFSMHKVFWTGNRLTVPRDMVKKLQSFPIADPTVKQLASASSQARRMLYQLIVDHINKGKRTRRIEKQPKEAISA